ncbi:MAG TPA: bifunctional glutamate N-acetyltransferase/amino-acid acetyltransferase ArgJ [Gemmataceae bacterium]|jgi:glutamate N-acetyltransferase/amino-acid N-acetyltransferase|nr:bifunctional glutamate N-acetyltransferase/amino-acid acetyltransferase ArgJ [Gemmataceae bacterium]
MKDWHLARGYRYAGVHSGLRPDPDRLDLAMVVSDTPASAAGVFTQNRVVAAPVGICRERLPRPDARGIVICSGNANACTGEQGLQDARRMAALGGQAIGCRAEQMLVCSTGVIGRPLPMREIEGGIHAAAQSLEPSAAALDRAAHAILTTDTRIKVSTRILTLDGADVCLTGFAKGAAMIGPNMATMLAFVLTDAAVSPENLPAIARRAAQQSFNCISVEGHTSTNDSLLLLANGQGPRLGEPQQARFEDAVTAVCVELAQAIIADAEGASHFVTISVDGLPDDDQAHKVAKVIAESALVKTAIFGADPNWGRFVSAAGYAGVPFEEQHLSLWLGDILLYHAGTPQPFDAATASAYLKNNRNIELRLRFTLGSGRCTFWTCDLGYEYIRLNAEYTT